MRTETFSHRARAGVAWALVRGSGDELLQVATTVVLARLLTPQEFGIAAAAGIFLTLATRLTQFGVGTSLVRMKEPQPAHLSSAFVLATLFGLVAWSGLAAAGPWLAAFVGSGEVTAVVRVAGAGFVISAFGMVPSAILTREMRFRDMTVSRWCRSGGHSATALTLAWSGFGYWSLVYGELAGVVALVLSRLALTRWRPRLELSRAASRDLLGFGTGFYVRQLIQGGAASLDRLVVGRWLGIAELGFYDKASSAMSRLVSRLNLAGPGISFRIFAIIQDDADRFRQAYRKVILAVTMVGYPALTGLAVMAPPLFAVIFGERWVAAAQPFTVLCLAGMLRSLNAYATSASQATGRIWPEVRLQALHALVLGAWTVALSPWGIVGVAVGVVLARAMLTVGLHAMVCRSTPMTWRDVLEPQIPGLACAAWIALALLTLDAALEMTVGAPGRPTQLAWQALTGMTAYAVFVRFARFPDLRALVGETLYDVAPALASWLRLSHGTSK